MSSLPGVKVGPLDPDRTAEFGQVSASNSARTLIRLHTQANPPQLRQALSRKLDEERTKGLVMDEVEAYLEGLTLPNGDPALPKGSRLVGANVRGERDRPQTLTYTFSVKGSGRTSKWFAPYDEDVLPESYEAGSERVEIAELKERGLVAPAPAVAPRPRRERPAKPAATDGISEAELADLRARAAEADDLRERVAELEDEDDPQEAAADGEVSAQDEPIEGYDDIKAAEVVKLLKSSDTDDETRQAILDYEKSHANRKGVVAAAEQSLGPRGAA